MQCKIVSYRNTCQQMAKYAEICNYKLSTSDLLTMIKICSLSSYFLYCLKKIQMHMYPDPYHND